jgi:hypothetical protein
MTKPDVALFFKVAITIFVAHLIADLGRQLPLSSLIKEDMYFVMVVTGQSLAYWVWSLILRSHTFLDKHHPWSVVPVRRFISQACLSTLMPAGLMFALICVLLFLLEGGAVFTREIILFELITVGSFTLGVNIVAVSRYLYFKLRETEKILERDFPYYPNL